MLPRGWVGTVSGRVSTACSPSMPLASCRSRVGLALRANLAPPVGVWLQRVHAMVPDPVRTGALPASDCAAASGRLCPSRIPASGRVRTTFALPASCLQGRGSTACCPSCLVCLEVGLALRANLAPPVGVWLQRVHAMVPDPFGQALSLNRCLLPKEGEAKPRPTLMPLPDPYSVLDAAAPDPTQDYHPGFSNRTAPNLPCT